MYTKFSANVSYFLQRSLCARASSQCLFYSKSVRLSRHAISWVKVLVVLWSFVWNFSANFLYIAVKLAPRSAFVSLGVYSLFPCWMSEAACKNHWDHGALLSLSAIFGHACLFLGTKKIVGWKSLWLASFRLSPSQHAPHCPTWVLGDFCKEIVLNSPVGAVLVSRSNRGLRRQQSRIAPCMGQ